MHFSHNELKCSNIFPSLKNARKIQEDFLKNPSLRRMILHACDDDEKFLCLHKRFKTISCYCDLLQNKTFCKENVKNVRDYFFNVQLCVQILHEKYPQSSEREHKAHYFNEILPSCTTHTAKCTQIMLYTCLRIIITQTLC